VKPIGFLTRESQHHLSAWREIAELWRIHAPAPRWPMSALQIDLKRFTGWIFFICRLHGHATLACMGPRTPDL
jgi:hypothetical protein